MTQAIDKRNRGWLLALALLALAGCNSMARPPAIPYDSAACLYQKVDLAYSIDAGQLQVPVAVARIEGKLVSYDETPTTSAGAAAGRLEVKFPHPTLGKTMALARVTIESKFTGALAPLVGEAKPSFTERVSSTVRNVPVVGSMMSDPTQVQEVWEMDIPRKRLDEIVIQLNHQRYFERGVKTAGPVQIDSKVEGQSLGKKWQRVEELDRLMVDVRAQGRLLSYRFSGDKQLLARKTPSSVTAYRNFAAQDAAQGPCAGGFVAGGAAFPGVTANPQGAGAANPQLLASQRPAYPQPRMAQALPSNYPMR